MSNYPVTKSVLDQVFSRLSDDVAGFNPVYNSLASAYSVPARMNIIFVPGSGNMSPNFARANVSPEDWVNTTALSWPFMTLFGISSNNRNLQKFHQFSGPVEIGVNVFLSWEQGRVFIGFDDYASCVEETMFTVFNRARNADPGDQDWGEDVVYNGGLMLTQSRLERGQEFWWQLLAFKASFEVNQRGDV